MFAAATVLKVWLTTVTPPTVTLNFRVLKPEPEVWVSSRPKIRWPLITWLFRLKVSVPMYSWAPDELLV